MEQLTEFVAKSFVEAKPTPPPQPVALEADKDPPPPVQTAHVISNLFSIPPMSSAGPTTTASGQWPLYPFPLFQPAEMTSAFQSKFSLNSMMERFGEIQNHFSRSSGSGFHYPPSMLYSQKSPVFPLLLPAESHFIFRSSSEQDPAKDKSPVDGKDDSGESTGSTLLWGKTGECN